MEGIRYVYFGDTRGISYHNGVVAVGYAYNPETKKMQYSVAFCSPNDRFIKRKARDIIKGRMKSGIYNESDATFDIPPKYADTIADIIKQFESSVEKFQLDENVGGNLNVSAVIKKWVLEGKDFNDDDIFGYINDYYYNLAIYTTNNDFPEFCGVSVPFWALTGLVKGR